jgi:hypothetical protein
MTSRQRLLATLRHCEPDRFAWAPLIDDYFMHGLPPEQAQAGIPALLRGIGADILLRHATSYQVQQNDVEVTETRQDSLILRAVETPIGPISETSQHYAGAETDYVIDYFIKSREDFARVCYWLEHQTLAPDYEATQRTIDEIGEDGLVTVNGGAPPLTGFFRFLPQEMVIFEAHDHPKELDRLAEAVHRLTYAQCCMAADSPADVVVAYSADITTRLISPKLYERYALPYLRECARAVHARGKIFVIHTCGDVRALLPLMRASEIDAIDSLSEPPLGNTPFELAMNVLGDGVCLIGGVSPIVLAMGTPEELRSHVLDLFARLPGRRNLVLCTSDATAYGTPLENLRLVGEMVKQAAWV